jgi:hypothetical protein
MPRPFGSGASVPDCVQVKPLDTVAYCFEGEMRCELHSASATASSRLRPIIAACLTDILFPQPRCLIRPVANFMPLLPLA